MTAGAGGFPAGSPARANAKITCFSTHLFSVTVVSRRVPGERPGDRHNNYPNHIPIHIDFA